GPLETALGKQAGTHAGPRRKEHRHVVAVVAQPGLPRVGDESDRQVHAGHPEIIPGPPGMPRRPMPGLLQVAAVELLQAAPDLGGPEATVAAERANGGDLAGPSP